VLTKSVNESIKNSKVRIFFKNKVWSNLNLLNPEHLTELQQLQPVFNLWASSEPEIGHLLSSIGLALDQIATEEQTLVSEFPHIVSQPLKEFILYIEAVKESLGRRDAIQIEYELVLEELSKKKAEKEQVVLIYFDEN
jgi:sorting nexin-7/30